MFSRVAEAGDLPGEIPVAKNISLIIFDRISRIGI